MVEPSRDLGGFLLNRFEGGVIQGVVTGAVGITRGGARVIRNLHDGLVRTYAFAMIGGVIGLAALMAWVVTQ